MVKPPKTMEPEALNLEKAGRDKSKAFGEDSFRNYMGRKIDMQRKQFGLVLPPPPQSSPVDQTSMGTEESSLASCSRNSVTRSRKKRKSSRSKGEHKKVSQAAKPQKLQFGINKVIQKLKKRHGDAKIGIVRGTSRIETLDSASPTKIELTLTPTPNSSPRKIVNCTKSSSIKDGSGGTKRKRSDLFFLGIVVIVNGYTNPDTETLQRLLHRHGGDLEKYETSRVTHVIAEALSTAKANMYKRQKQPRPVCKPSWITDSVAECKLLPVSQYLIDEVKEDGKNGVRSVATFFGGAEANTSFVTLEAASAEKRQFHPLPSTASKRKKRVSFMATSQTKAIQQYSNESPKDSISAETKRWASPCDSSPLSKPSIQAFALEDNATTENEHSNDIAESPPKKANTGEPFRYINGKVRTVGTDPNFLESFFASSRLSFIGSYKQRAKQSPTKINSARTNKTKRYVFHVDLDSFFASVVLRNYPQYKDKPVAISHHGDKDGGGQNGRHIPVNSSSECATCNYEARKFGIKKGMYLGQAKTLCPELIVLQYDFQGYEEVSTAMYNILDDYAVKFDGYVEQVSCDEAYMELFVTCSNENTSEDEVAAEVAEAIRKKVFETTQCTASVGVAKNKFIAKLSTDSVKPNGSLVTKDARDLLRPLRLKQLHGIGYRLNQRLEESGLVSVQDVWDMGTRGESELCRLLGPGLGKKIHGFCNGVDDRSVEPAERKTIGAECNYGVRFDGPYGVDHLIRGLCQEVERRMDKVGVRGSRLTLKIKQRKPGAPPPPKFLGHGSCYNHSKSSELSTGKASREWKSMQITASLLFKALDVSPDDIRGMGIVMSKLIADDGNASNSDATNTTQKSISTLFAAHRASKATGSQQMNETPKGVLLASPVSEVCPTGASTPKGQESASILLPSSSQIRMSQVKELPSPLRKEITAEMQRTKRVAAPRPQHQISPNRRGQGEGDNIDLSPMRQDDREVEVLSDSNAVNAATPRRQDSRFDDVALPPMSQIHMSQVKALPIALQKEIAKRMQNEADPFTVETDLDAPKQQTTAAGKLRQTDMKRMLKLAAVKSKPGSVSLTELASLPLEMQLQVANNDTQRLGLLSPPARGQKRQASVPTGAIQTRHVRTRSESPSRSAPTNSPTPVVLSFLEPTPAPNEFYMANILPLMTFMNNHPDVSAEARNTVLDFLHVCIDEHRLSDVVRLLRCIYRHAAWGREAYQHMVVVLDRRVYTILQCSLDLDWIEGTEGYTEIS